MSLKKIILKYFHPDYFQSYRSYSQEGEDMVLRSFYEGKKGYKGFYIDIGAHHPYRFSNTMYFYKHGWKGINIEPTPTVIKLFKILRKRDITLNIGIAANRQKLKFYCFNEPALNGFSEELSNERNEHSKYKILKTIDIDTYSLEEVLDTYLPANQPIDFLSIDVEGLDFQVLKSNNWEKYQPQYILIEDRIAVKKLEGSEIYTYLNNKGYELVAKTLRTLFFKKDNLLPV